MDNTQKAMVELFIVEYKCFTCAHQWLFTSAEIISLQTCGSCGGYARVLNVVSKNRMSKVGLIVVGQWPFVK